MDANKREYRYRFAGNATRCAWGKTASEASDGEQFSSGGALHGCCYSQLITQKKTLGYAIVPRPRTSCRITGLHSRPLAFIRGSFFLDHSFQYFAETVTLIGQVVQ